MVALKIDMPKNCHDCPCAYWTEGCFHDYCQAAGYNTELIPDLETRPDWCPFILITHTERLTPKKPKVSVDTWVCPACGRDVEYQVMLGDSIIFHGQHNFCPNCGQAIDWEEPPEEGET